MQAPKVYDLSPQQAAERLGVHVDTVKRWADKGKLPCWTTPGGWRRFAAEDLDALVAPRGAA